MKGAEGVNAGPPVITLRVTVRAPDLEGFIERYSKHIDGDRIFIFTKNPQPVGTRVQFTLQLATGEQLIHGKGTVTRVQSSSQDRRHPTGMELLFVPLDDRSQTLVEFLLATREAEAPPLVRAVASRSAPPPPPAAEIGRGDAQGIDTDDGRVSVPVTSQPPGARVSIDGVPHPQPTPTTLDGLDPHKIYQIGIALDGHRPFQRKVRPKSGEKLQALLFPIERILELSSDPPGAELSLDGKPLGRTPHVVRRLDRKRDHQLQLRLEGYEPHDAEVAASAFEIGDDRERLRLHVALKPALSAEPLPPVPTIRTNGLSLALETSTGETTAVAPPPLPSAAASSPSNTPALSASSGSDQSASSAAHVPPPGAAEAPSSSEAAPAVMSDSGKLALALAEHAPPVVAPELAVGPGPALVEKWREPLPPGAPAAGMNGNVPANPFSEVSDGAIEYFVEWSLEQSIGPRAEPSSQFSGVAMALPGSEPPPERKRRSAREVVLFIGGALFGAAVVLALVQPWRHRAPAAVAVQAAPPVQPSAPAPPPPPAPTTVELALHTRPPGASLFVDDKPVGESPVTVPVAPGRHEIRATKERYEPATATAEAPGELTLALERPLSKLRIVSSPPGAQITIGKEKHGRTPSELKLPAFESYEVQLVLAGKQTWRRSIYLRPPVSTMQATMAATPSRPAKGGAVGQRSR